MRSVASIAVVTPIVLVAFFACAEQSLQGPEHTVASIVVTPASDTLISLGETVQLTATARNANGATVAGVSFTWSSSDGSCATVNSSGLVTASENGNVTITASTGSVSGSASITVTQIPASVAVAPASASLASVGETLQLTASALDANAHEIAGSSFSWESSDDGVATVDDSGLVTAVADGAATINASTDGVPTPGTAEITVAQHADSVALSPTGASISGVGATQQFAVEAWDARGSPIPDPPVTWISLNPDIATVDPSTGEATAVESGQVTIAATANGTTGYALLTVVVPGVEPVNLWSEMWRGDPTERALAIWGTSDTDVYAAGDFAEVRHYDGTSWSAMGGWFGGAVWGTSARDVYLMSWHGSILHYDGSSWSEMESGTGSTLRGLWGASPSDVYAVGEAGVILHYDGSTWSAMPSGTFEDLNDVWGTSSTDVYAVGNSGTILHYDGSSWSAVVGGLSADVTAVWGTSATDIYAVAQWPDMILHYDGSSWNAMPGGTIHRPAAVWGSSATDIYAMGFAGAMFHYDGSDWDEMESGTGSDLEDAWGTAGANVYVVGAASLILRGVRGASVTVTPHAHTLTSGGETIQLAAEARDADADPVSGVTFAWKSSDLSVASVNATGLVTALSNGTAAIAATVPGGAADTAIITVTLSQLPPVAVIENPSQDTTVTLGEAVDFQGTASDADGTIAGHNWDFGDGNGASVEDPGPYTYASVGTYTVTYQVTDDDGAKSLAASVAVTVVLNQPPTASITSPTGGASFAVGETVTFTGSGADHEDGDLTGAALIWSSSLDGQIGAGTSFTRDDLSLGTHTITLTVEDTDGATATAAVTITVAALDPIVSGVWHGTTGAGFTFDFTVATAADYVTQIQYFWSGLSCEGVTRVSGSVTVSSTPGWIISNRQFVVDPSDEPTITGTFDASGMAASGSWQWLSCSGTWAASP